MSHRTVNRNKSCRRTLAVVVGGLGLLTGCNEEEALRTFRDAAAESLESGVQAIFDGVVTGAFAVFELGAEGADSESAATDATTSGGTDTGAETGGESATP